ncbi:hypothetical protein D3C81_2265130 [compost metagenome]
MIVAVAELIWMIEPPALIASMTVWKNRNGPLNCRASIRSSSSSLVSRKPLVSPQPAVLTATSSLPPQDNT